MAFPGLRGRAAKEEASLFRPVGVGLLVGRVDPTSGAVI